VGVGVGAAVGGGVGLVVWFATLTGLAVGGSTVTGAALALHELLTRLPRKRTTVAFRASLRVIFGVSNTVNRSSAR
jgi:hypothetical protein